MKSRFSFRTPVFGLFFLAFLLRVWGVFSPSLGLGRAKSSLYALQPSENFVACLKETDCFLPASYFLFRLPLYLGLTPQVVFYWAKGLSLFLGLAFLFILFQITKKAFPGQKILPLLLLFVLAVNPQFVFLSCFPTSFGLGLTAFLAAFWFLLARPLSFFSVLGVAFFSGLTLFSSAFLWLPSGLILAVLLYLTRKEKRHFLISIALSFLLFSSWLWLNKQTDFLPLKSSLAFFSDIGFINAINASRGTEREFGFPFLARALYNKAYFLVFWLSHFLGQYRLSNLFSIIEPSDSTLFLTKPMLLVFTPFFVWGFLSSFGLLSFPVSSILLLFLLLGGIPSSLASSFFYQLPFSLALIPIAFYTALGMTSILKKSLWRRFFYLFCFLNLVFTYFKIFTEMGL